jgi:hypothetical protein
LLHRPDRRRVDPAPNAWPPRRRPRRPPRGRAAHSHLPAWAHRPSRREMGYDRAG